MTIKSYGSLSQLSGESIKRLKRQVNTDRFANDAKAPFDDRVRDTLLQYANSPKYVRSVLKSLDDVEYGCKFTPGELDAQILHFTEGHAKSFRWNQHYQSALKALRDSLSILPPLKIQEFHSDQDILDALSKKDSHAGFQFILSGLKTKEKNIDGAYRRYMDEEAMALEYGSFKKPILPGHRLQCSVIRHEETNEIIGSKKKTRLVNMIDMNVIIAEMHFSKSVQNLMANWKHYAAGKPQSKIHSAVRVNQANNKFWLSLDYSKYDQTLPGWFIKDVFDVIWSLFSKDWHTQAFKPLWDVVVHDFIHKEFCATFGIVSAHDGVPSGSMFTQIIDSLCNYVMIKTYVSSLSRKTGLKRDVDMLICGDDNLIHSNFKIEKLDIAGYLSRNFGVVCNGGKCEEKKIGKEDPIFLSRVWKSQGEWREPVELIAHLMFPERRRPYLSNRQMKPELILYSYILAYPLGMRDIMNVDKFLEDNSFRMDDIFYAVRNYMTGNLRYRMLYENLGHHVEIDIMSRAA